MRTPTSVVRNVALLLALAGMLTSCGSNSNKPATGGPTCGSKQILCNASGMDAGWPHLRQPANGRCQLRVLWQSMRAGRGMLQWSVFTSPHAGPRRPCAILSGKDAGGPHCANTLTDNANCGSCGNQCEPGEACSSGQCTTTCQPNETLCGADTDAGAAPYCANLQSDNANCGCCGNACGPNQGCQNGRCDNSDEFQLLPLWRHARGSAEKQRQCPDCHEPDESDRSQCGGCLQ